MSVSERDIAHWRSWIGKRETRAETLSLEAVQRYAAAIGEDLDVTRAQPSLAHWAFFLPVAADADIGPDGHPKRGGFLPPVSLPRRMFAASAMTFAAPLDLGAPATLTEEVAAVTHKAGKSGDLVFVEIERRIEQGGAVRVTERQTIVYRHAGAAMAPVEDARLAAPEGAERWAPNAVNLFRFSAATFNSHRIHYDAAYARDQEGYPGLVVQGPFIAAKLLGYARRKAGRSVTSISFRALAPLFADQPVLLCAGDAADEAKAVRADGAAAMTARFAAATA